MSTTGQSRCRLLAAALVLVLTAGCNPPPPGPGPTPSPTPSVTGSSSPSPQPSPTPSATPTIGPTPTASPQPAEFPNHSSTGAPAESGLAVGPCTLAANTTYDRRRFQCSTLQMAAGSKVTNSVIEGFVRGGAGTFVIEDSTITSATCVGNEPAVAYDNYILRRVHIRGFNDGVRVEGPGVKVYDSLIENCFFPDGHADGIQVCPNPPCGGSADTSGLVFHHNTVVHRKDDSTGAIFVMGGSTPGYQITNNLLMGYSITVRLHAAGTFTGNRIVSDSGMYREFDVADGCRDRAMVWSDNRLVTMVGAPPPPGETAGDLTYGPDYRVASVGAEVTCG